MSTLKVSLCISAVVPWPLAIGLWGLVCRGTDGITTPCRLPETLLCQRGPSIESVCLLLQAKDRWYIPSKAKYYHKSDSEQVPKGKVETEL